ncbi:MAG TPA: M24 family metallopeptidase, partial [Dehalococcoidia bacterium]|nr:M24 family metallopeptidase [Dehalococcoidia bacterium]
MRYELTPRDELYARISKFQRQLQNQSIEAALIQENSDLFYFSGSIQRSILFIPAQGEPVLAVSGNLQRAGEESRLKYIVPLESQRQLDKLLTDFDLAVSGRIGLDMDVLPSSLYISMQNEYKNARFINISDIIRKLRMIKSAWEVDRIRRACKMQDEIMQETLRIVRVGMTELDIDALLTAYARRRGHQGQFRSRGFNQPIHYAHILFGKNSAIATYIKGPLGGMGVTPAYPIGSSFNVITENGPLIVDFGIGLGGYISDMTRTFVIGRLPRDMEKAHALSREIKYFLQEQVRPGKSPADLYREIISMVEKKGL